MKPRSKVFRFILRPVLLLCSIVCAADAQECNFRVGVIAALSGRLAEYGTAVQNGIELAREDRPDLLNCLQFIYEDDQYDPKIAVRALQKLIDIDKVSLLFTWGNEPALALAPIVEARKVPSLMAVQHRAIPSRKSGYILRFLNSASNWQKTMADYIRQEDVRSVLIVKTDMSFTDMLVEELKLHLAPDIRVTVLDSVLPQQTDFRSLVSRAKRQKFDMLGVYLVPGQSVEFLKQAAEQHFVPRLMGSTFFESRTALLPVWDHLQGAIYLHLAVDEEFRRKFAKRFNSEDQVPYAWNAYQFALFAGRRFNVPRKNWLAADVREQLLREIPGEEPMQLVSEGQEQYFRFPLAIQIVEGPRVRTVFKQ